MSDYFKIGKKALLGALFLIVLIITINTALAAVEITQAEIVFNVDYSDFKDEDQTVLRRNIDIPIKNTETSTVAVAVSITGLPSRYNMPAINTVAIPAGETRIVSVAIDVPHQQSSGKRQIGMIEIRNANSNTPYDTALLIQDTKIMLSLDEIIVEYEDIDGETERETVNGDDSSLDLDEGLRPGSQVTITFNEIENLFNENYDEDSSDIEDITLTIEVDDNDLFKDDFEEEYDLGAIGAEEKNDFEVVFTVDEEADEGKYVFTIKLEGEDGEGAKHTTKTELTLEVERNRDDIRIIAFEISPENPVVCDKNVVFSTEIKNIGTRSQNNVAIQLFSPTLEITQTVPNLKLDRFSKDENSYSKSFLVNLASKDLEPGRHDVEFSVFLDDDERIDHQRKTIIVGECNNPPSAAGIINESEKSTIIEITTNKEQDQSENKLDLSNTRIVSSGQIVSTIEDPYSSEDVLVSLIIITIILLLAVIAIFTVIIIKNNSEVSKK